MKAPVLTICLSVFSTSLIAAAETTVEPRIESVGLFKNGLAVVRASFEVPKPGIYRWDRVPHVVHGSFWIESEGVVSVQSSRRMVAVSAPHDSPTGHLQHDLAGREIEITLKTGQRLMAPAVINGRVMEIPTHMPVTWDTNYSSLNTNSGYHWYRSSHTGQPAQHVRASTGRFLILESEAGHLRYVDQEDIGMVKTDGPFAPVQPLVESPVLLFNVGETPDGDGVIRVSWLAKGLAWMPSYQIDLKDPGQLTIRQGAVVRNESDDLKNTEIRLISGFPNVGFGSVDSPLWQGTTLAAFFNQLNQAGNRSRTSPHAAVGQQLVMTNVAEPAGQGFVADAAEQGQASDDIHYESIGLHSLAAGDSLSIDVAVKTAEYKRVVEWVVPDERDVYGRYYRNDRLEHEDVPWDAVRFTNPFAFPMTTAPALVTEAGNFRGQSLSTWVNPGQRASVRITRALSVTAEASEVEDEGAREPVMIGGSRHRRTSVTGRLSVKNYRGNAVTMSIQRDFSGKMLEAEGAPEVSLRTVGIASINERRRLEWTFDLPAGEEREITYRYQVLVRE